ncbi:glycosyltransferase family 4 protein [Actinomycetes bacterium M1A6_2h]
MKILHVVNEIVDTGNGIVNVCVDLAVAQKESGHDVSVASVGGGFERLLQDKGIAHHRVSFDRRPKQLLSAARALTAIIGRHRPDVVHIHTLTPSVVVAVVRKWNRYRFLTVTTVHNEYQRGVRLMGLADAVVGVSIAVTDAMEKHGVHRRKLATVLNGPVGTQRRRNPSTVEALRLSGKSVVALGAVSERKGVDVLFDACSLLADRHPDLNLYYVGNVDWTEFRDRAMASRWSSRIHFVGLDKEPARYLRSAEVFVLASRREPFGLVLLEAREVGVPIVATRVDGIPEALDGGDAGLLVEPEDPVALSEAISSIVSNDVVSDDLRLRSSQGLERFTVDRMAASYMNIYESGISVTGRG